MYASGSARRSASAVLLGVLPSVEDAVLDELTHRVKLCADQCVEPLVEMKPATGRENVSSSTNVASSWRWGDSHQPPELRLWFPPAAHRAHLPMPSIALRAALISSEAQRSGNPCERLIHPCRTHKARHLADDRLGRTTLGAKSYGMSRADTKSFERTTH